MARYECNRCKTELNTTNSEGHICKDLAKRYARQEKAAKAIVSILDKHYPDDTDQLEVALEIIKRISGLDLGDT